MPKLLLSDSVAQQLKQFSRLPLSGCRRHGITGQSSQTTPRHTLCICAASRRSALKGLVGLVPLVLLTPQAVEAAPLTVPDWLDDVLPGIPIPVKYPRRNLDGNFAELVLKATYQTVDDLNFIAMDEFQNKFEKTRKSEQEQYELQLNPVKMRSGDLTDPLYFDLVSFTQFEVVNRNFYNAPNVFKEYCEKCAERGDADPFIVVQRDAALQDNQKIPLAFMQGVGDNIYNLMLNGFKGEVYNVPQPCSADTPFETVVANVQQLLDCMVNKGLALKATIMDVQPASGSTTGGSFAVDMHGPANKWGLSMLMYRLSWVRNPYDALVVDSYFRRSGINCKPWKVYNELNKEVGYLAKWTIL